MAATSIAALVAIILFFIYLGWIFFFSVLELLINGIAIYAIFLRAWVEIVREERHYFYLGGAAAAMVLYILAGNFLSGILVWGVTTYLLLAFAFSQLGLLGHCLYKRRREPGQKKQHK